MSMSTHIIGFKAPDEKWETMRAVWDACEAARIDPPKEVSEYFGWQSPDPLGVEVNLPISEWGDECRRGYELDVKLIPQDITHIRFYNAW